MSLDTELAAIHNSLRSLHEKTDRIESNQGTFVTQKDSWTRFGILGGLILAGQGIVDFKDFVIKYMGF
jgi:hypothetical protein